MTALNYARNKHKIDKRNAKWVKNNPEKIERHKRKWHLNNPEKVKANREKWIKNNPERNLENKKRRNAKRKRSMGFIPLNKKFDGADGHHIDKQHVVYIPKELHMSVIHNQNNKESMETINELTLNWMLGV